MRVLDSLVVGGGISGLSTAWWLGKAGARVEVWESTQRPGGKIQTRCYRGFRMEQAATMLVESNDRIRHFLAQAGLDQFRHPGNPPAKRYLVNNGKLVSLPQTPLALLSSALWSRRGLLRMMLEPLIPGRRPDDETVREFITRRFGTELYDKAMEPYIAGALASDPERACARSVLPQLTAMERRFGSIVIGMLWQRLRGRAPSCRPVPVFFTGGMQTLTDQLAADPVVGFRSGLRIVEISRHKGGWKVHAESAGGEVSVYARHLVLSIPAADAARLVSALDTELAELLGGIEYAPLSVVHLGFDKNQIRHSLDGSGFLLPRQEQKPVNGVLWMSSLVPDCAPQGKALMTAYIGGARNPQAVQWTDERSHDAVLATLDGLLGVRGSPDCFHIMRHVAALPQYIDGFHTRVRAIAERCAKHQRLHLSANYLGGVAVRARIEQGYLCASNILRQLEQESTRQNAPAFLNRVHPSQPHPGQAHLSRI